MVEKCYHGSNLIKRIYAGSNRIKRVYKGSTLVWNLHPYEPNTVIYESSTGGASSTLSLPEGLYQVICIGGGGGGAASYRTAQGGAKSAGGGSGSGFNCVFNLSAGNYAVAVGSGGASHAKNGGMSYSHQTGGTGGNSRFGSSYAYGGGGGEVASDGTTTAGSAGSAPTLTYTRTTTTLNKAGNKGSTASGTYDATGAGGAAVYGSYGKGGHAGAHKDSANVEVAGNAGYVKVVYIDQA